MNFYENLILMSSIIRLFRPKRRNAKFGKNLLNYANFSDAKRWNEICRISVTVEFLINFEKIPHFLSPNPNQKSNIN